MEIKPIRRTSISDQVSMQIKQLILDKDWKPGERIPSETELAELRQVCDRIAIVSDGKIVDILPADADNETIGLAMSGDRR